MLNLWCFAWDVYDTKFTCEEKWHKASTPLLKCVLLRVWVTFLNNLTILSYIMNTELGVSLCASFLGRVLNNVI